MSHHDLAQRREHAVEASGRRPPASAAHAISRGRRSVERSAQVVSASAVIRRLRGWRRSLRRRGTLPAVFPFARATLPFFDALAAGRGERLKWSHRIMVSTHDSQSCCRGSIPLGTA